MKGYPLLRLALALGMISCFLWIGEAEAQGRCFDTLTNRIKNEPNLKYFSSALSQTGLDLSGPGPYLVFAPTDSAFTNLDDSAVLNMELSKLISYTIATTAGYEKFLDLTPGSPSSIPTLCSDCNELTVETLSSGRQVLNQNVYVSSVTETCNGLLATIDTLLVPGQRIGDNMDSNLENNKPIVCSLDDPSCCDEPPPEFTCSDQKLWNKCDEPWMLLGNGNGGFCRYTCGRCGRRPSFADRSPETDYSEEETNEDDYNRGFRPPRSPIDPRISCQCSPDGISGNVDTGESGCFKGTP